jgi:hypothetical protein
MDKAWNMYGTDVKCSLEVMRLFVRQRYRLEANITMEFKENRV